MKALKKVGGLLIAVVAIILAKFKLAAIFAVKVLIVSLINMTMHKDSTAVASRPHTAKPQRQVAQATAPKTNPAEKVAAKESGAMAMTSARAVEAPP